MPVINSMDRLRQLVRAADAATYTTTTGVVKPKTAKQREIDKAVAEQVVRFAFDHAGITGDERNLAPSGLYIQLLEEARNGQ